MHESAWQIRPAQPEDREFLLKLTPRLTQGVPLPPGRTAERRSCTLLGVVLYGAALVADWALLYPRSRPASQGNPAEIA